MRSNVIHMFLMVFGVWTVGTDAQCSTTGRFSVNATATRTAAASVPSCSIFTGKVVVFNTTELDLNGWDTIDGDLEIIQHTLYDTTYIQSTTLRNISGKLIIRSPDYTAPAIKLGQVSTSFPALDYIGQVIVGGTYLGIYNGLSLDFGENTTTEAVSIRDIQGQGGPQYNTLYLNISTFRSLSPNEIKRNEASHFFSTVVSLNSSFDITDNGFESIEMPQLESFRGLVISGNKELERIEVAAVTAGSLEISDNGRETSMVLDRLTTLTGTGRNSILTGFATFSNLVSLKLPQLREVNGSYYPLSFSENLFSELHLTNLQTVNKTFEILNNSVLIDLSLPRLAYAKQLNVRNNPRLLNFTANVLKRVEKVHLEGNFTNVELFSVIEVTGDFKLIGSPSMDCSWFDDNFFQKVVKGGYQCIGNHTRPLIPRRPSTATEVAELDSGSTSASPGVSPSNISSNEQEGSGGLSTGAKAGIGVGVGVGALLLLGIGAFIFWRRKKAGPESGVGGEAEQAELGDNSEPKVVGSVPDIPEDKTLSPVTVELDSKSGGLVETRHELGDKEEKSKPALGAVERSELP